MVHQHRPFRYDICFERTAGGQRQLFYGFGSLGQGMHVFKVITAQRVTQPLIVFNEQLYVDHTGLYNAT
jgi:hypothetical protein